MKPVYMRWDTWAGAAVLWGLTYISEWLTVEKALIIFLVILLFETIRQVETYQRLEMFLRQDNATNQRIEDWWNT